MTEYMIDKNGRKMRKPSGRPAVSWLERWVKFVDENGPVPEHRPDLGPCHIWTGGLDPDGYAIFSAPGSKPVRGHRWIYTHVIGAIAEGLELDHLCRVRNCVRPTHLDPVTTKENWERSRPWRVLTRDNRGVFTKRDR